MPFDLNMDNYKIVNLNEPTLNSDAATKKYVDNKTRINPSHSLTNTFKYLMDDINEISTEYGLIADKIDDLSWSPHENKKVLYFKALKDGLNYRYRLGFQMTQASPIANTIAIEQLFNNENYWNKAQISINGTGIAIESSHTNKFHFGNYYYTKTIIQLKRLTAPVHQLYYTTHIDNITSSPMQLQQYLLAYGVNSFMSDVDSIVYNIPLFKNINDKMQMQVELDMNNKKIINLASPTDDNDAISKNYLDNYIDTISYKFISTNIPVVENLIIHLEPLIRTVTVNADEKINTFKNLGTIHNFTLSQRLDSKKPTLFYNEQLDKYYLNFKQNDILQSNDFTFPVEFTIFLLVRSFNSTNNIIVDFAKDSSSFSIKLSGLENSIQITNSISISDYDVIRQITSNLSSDKVLWTIRVTKEDSNRRVDIFKGISTNHPIKVGYLNHIIRDDVFLSLFHFMQFYQLLFYNISLTNLEMKYIFRYFKNEYKL